MFEFTTKSVHLNFCIKNNSNAYVICSLFPEVTKARSNCLKKDLNRKTTIYGKKVSKD